MVLAEIPSPLQSPVLRDDLPRYPHLQQLVRVTSSLVQPFLYVAYTQQLRSDGSLLPRDREPCLALDVNHVGLPPGYYLGRLASSSSNLPVYECIGYTAPTGFPGGSTAPSSFPSSFPTGGDTTCDLVTLRRTDCLLAVSSTPESILLVKIGSNWSSGSINMIYPAGSGQVLLWFRDGLVHLSVDGKELIGCGNGCWEGGAATGHVNELPLPTIPPACGGQIFRVCVHCVVCPDCSTLPNNLSAEIVATGGVQPCTSMEGDYTLVHGLDPLVGFWDFSPLPGAASEASLTCTNNGDGTVTLSIHILCGATNIGSGSAVVSLTSLSVLDVTIPVTMVDPSATCTPSNCIYTWNAMAATWTLSLDCAGICVCTGSPTLPGTIDGETQNFPCVGTAPCCVGTMNVRVTL